MIEITDWARDILTRAHAAATRFNPDARVRLARSPGGIEATLTEEESPGDQHLDVNGTTVLAEAGIQGLIDIEEPHDRLVLRPAGSTPNTSAH